MIRDSNGTPLNRNVRREANGYWYVTVWFGGVNGMGTDVRRYGYRTREQARNGDISDDFGARTGRIA
jgi:hypothetical protein